MEDSAYYRSLGVSSAKEDVVKAAAAQGEGLFPGAFCKVVADALTGDGDYCLALHADGAGTKAIVAYLAYKESGDPRLFASLAQDALVMNLDDLLCIGAAGPFLVSNTIGRHRGLIPGEAIEAIIAGYEELLTSLAPFGVELVLCGGETADVGDVVRTLMVDASAVCRLRRDKVLDGSLVRPGDLIIGLSSSGQASYESSPNSGIGSNGLTLARHALLSSHYRSAYPEAVAPDVSEELAYRGPYRLADQPSPLGMSVGQALLSPTRTYAPILCRALAELPAAIHGLVHCTGGGQTKCLRLGGELRFVKEELLPVPPVFSLIRQAADLPWSEMYQVFNMGHRMELFVDAAAEAEVVALAAEYGVKAQTVGRCEQWNEGPRLQLAGPEGWLTYGATKE
jgi:phosphoribosylformylglycinamidine cyclo-ligase